MLSPDSTILVTGATGAQGGATARTLLKAGLKVRFLTRSLSSEAAKSLINSGAEGVVGDLEIPESVHAAMAGCYGVFSVQVPDVTQTDSERRHALTLIKAAQEQCIQHFVHTSVCEAGKHTDFPEWGTGRWSEKYWSDKWDIEEAVRNAGFPIWTVLKPAFMMENYAQPKAQFMFPHLAQGLILTALESDNPMQLISADDVGRVACLAFANPQAFHQLNIDLAADSLTMGQIADAISQQLGTAVKAQSVSPSAAVEAGLFPGWVNSQEWNNLVGYRADIGATQAFLKRFNLTLEDFASWLKNHAPAVSVNA